MIYMHYVIALAGVYVPLMVLSLVVCSLDSVSLVANKKVLMSWSDTLPHFLGKLLRGSLQVLVFCSYSFTSN